MTPEHLNDLAFNLIEKSVVPSEKVVLEYLEANSVPYEDYDYFLVFMKHWIYNKIDLKFSDILIFLSGYKSVMAVGLKDKDVFPVFKDSV